MQPLVSVVIPTYRRPDRLERALNSVCLQTYTNWELIVVDDNHPDCEDRFMTSELMQSYVSDGRIRYQKHKWNRGGGAARNTGICEAKGEFVAFLDDDDEWVPEKLERQLRLFKEGCKSLGLVYTGTRVIDVAAGTETIVKPVLRGDIFPAILARNRIGTTSTIMCRKEALIRAGLFDENFPAAQDYDLYIRIALQYHFDYLPDPLVVRMKHSGERVTNLGNKLSAHDLLYKKYIEFFEANSALHSAFLARQGKVLMQAGNRGAAMDKFLFAFRLRPTSFGPLLLASLAAMGRGVYTSVRLSTRYARTRFRAVLKRK
jgi:glycosyltransferase involved in cell wall biosynthesis